MCINSTQDELRAGNTSSVDDSGSRIGNTRDALRSTSCFFLHLVFSVIST